MGGTILFIITLINLDDMESNRVVVKFDRHQLSDAEYYNEPKVRAEIYALLPYHIQSLGRICDIQETDIFDIVVSAK